MLHSQLKHWVHVLYFSEAYHQESSWSWHLWKTFNIVHFKAFCCIQSAVHIVSEIKNKIKSFLFKWLSSDSFEICCNEMFLTYPSQTRETNEAPFRPIPFHIQAQQKHQRHNTHSFCKTHILTLKKTGSFVWILSIYFSSVFNTIQPHLKESKLETWH